MELQKYLVIVKSYKYQDIAFLKTLKFVYKICALFGAIYYKWDFFECAALLCFIVFCVFCYYSTKKQKSMHLHSRICNLVLLGILSAFPPANGSCSSLTLMPFNRYSQNSLPNWTCNVSLCTAFWLFKGISVKLESKPFSDTRTVEMLGKNWSAKSDV